MGTTAPGVETLEYELLGLNSTGSFAPILVGVVGSGNLEILVEPTSGNFCRVHVVTSARGFGTIWQAVIRDFQQRHSLAGVLISIHDMGATPAVVSLRLAQAVAELPGEKP